MPRPYKARNKRIIMRAQNGRFRKTTVADAGIVVCPQCNHIMTKRYPESGRFINPAAIKYVCGNCGHEAKPSEVE